MLMVLELDVYQVYSSSGRSGNTGFKCLRASLLTVLCVVFTTVWLFLVGSTQEYTIDKAWNVTDLPCPVRRSRKKIVLLGFQQQNAILPLLTLRLPNQKSSQTFPNSMNRSSTIFQTRFLRVTSFNKSWRHGNHSSRSFSQTVFLATWNKCQENPLASKHPNE